MNFFSFKLPGWSSNGCTAFAPTADGRMPSSAKYPKSYLLVGRVRAGCATSLLGCLIWPTGGPVDRLCFLLTRQRDQNPNNFPTCFCLLFSTLYWKYCWKGQCHEKGLAFYQMSCCFRSKQWTAKWFYTCFRSSAKCYRISTLFLIVVLSCS